MLTYDSYKVELKVGSYEDNKNLYVGLDYYDEECECMIPLGNITTNVPYNMNYLEAAINTNNMGKSVLSFLKDNNLAENTGKTVCSGFCEYPVYRFNEDMLFKISPMKFASYKRYYRGKK